MADEAGTIESVSETGELEWSPPQTELDANIRNVLSHIVHHQKTISMPLGELPKDGYIMWDVAQIPNGDKVITIWWAEGGTKNEDS